MKPHYGYTFALSQIVALIPSWRIPADVIFRPVTYPFIDLFDVEKKMEPSKIVRTVWAAVFKKLFDACLTQSRYKIQGLI